MKQGESIEVLLVHRGAVDAGWIEQALSEGDLRHRLTVLGNAAEALAWLRRGTPASAARPDAILLGSNWGEAESGAGEPDLLAELAADAALAAIPVVVVAASSEPPPTPSQATRHALDRLLAHEITPALLARSVRYAIARRRVELLELERREGEQATQRARFVAAVMAEVTRSLDLAAALRGLSRMLVPRLADAVVIDLLEDDGRLVPFAQAGVGGELPAIDPRSGAERQPVLRAIGQRESAWLAAIEPRGADERLRALAERAAARAMLVTPLVARGMAIGAISYVLASPERATAEARRLAEEVASSVALAIDNLRLFAQSQRAIRGRDELLAIVSHDLRNPINVMALAVAALESSAGPQPQTLRRMKRALRRMEHLIDDLLDVARVDAGRLKVELSPLPLGPVLDEVIEQWRPLCAEKGITLGTAPAAQALGPVQLDRQRVIQVLSNLIGNAVQFTPPGGSVRLGAEASGPWVKVSVTDTGSGIAPENLPHVFDRFWQKERRAGGLGLGLAIAEGIVAAHGGSIHVESALGGGTTFWFTLRRAQA